MRKAEAKRNSVAEFHLHPVLPGSDAALSKGCYIILLDAKHVPPHLLVSLDGEVHSVSSAGRQMGSALEKLLTFIRRKNIPTLFLEWKTGKTAEETKRVLHESFSKYPKLEAGQSSCLSPIRDTAVILHGEEMHPAKFIFELLPLLKAKDAMGNAFGFFTEETFVLNHYTTEAVNEAIRNSAAPSRATT